MNLEKSVEWKTVFQFVLTGQRRRQRQCVSVPKINNWLPGLKLSRSDLSDPLWIRFFPLTTPLDRIKTFWMCELLLALKYQQSRPVHLVQPNFHFHSSRLLRRTTVILKTRHCLRQTPLLRVEVSVLKVWFRMFSTLSILWKAASGCFEEMSTKHKKVGIYIRWLPYDIHSLSGCPVRRTPVSS